MTIVTVKYADGSEEDMDLTFPVYSRLKEPLLFAGILSNAIRVQENGEVTSIIQLNLNGNQLQVNAMLQSDIGLYLGAYVFHPQYEQAEDSTEFDTALTDAFTRFNTLV